MQAESRVYARLNSFWLLNLPVFIFIFFGYLNFASQGFEAISFAYFFLLSLSQAAGLSWLLLVALPYLGYFISFKKLSPYPLAFLLSLASLFMLVLDKNIYSQFHLHLQWVFLQMIASPARSHIFNLSKSELYIIFGVIIFLIAVLSVFLLLIKKRTFNPKLIISCQLLCILAGVTTQGIYLWADAIYEPRLLVATELIPGFYGITAKRFLAKHHLILSRKRPPSLLESTQSNLQYPLKPLRLSPEIKKTNIIILAIDAWRADAMNVNLTPQIAKLSQSASVYENHFSGGNSTRAGIFSLFYSISPQLFDTAYRGSLGPLLFDVLKKRDYESYAFTSASALSPPFSRTVFINLPNFEPTLPGEDSVARDRLVNSKLIAAVDESLEKSKPFFAFGFYDSAHAYLYPSPPFKPVFQPSARVGRVNLSDPEQALLWRNQYSNSVYFIDGLIGELIEHLRTKNVLDNTLIIITGDHGEEFNDNKLGSWGHNSNFTPSQTQVPLVVHWPNQKQAEVLNYATSHYDIIPTIFKNLGVENPSSDYSIGKELQDKSDREPILMGSYSGIAALSLHKKRLIVTNQLGYFQMQTLQGSVTKETLDSELLAKAYLKMQHFSKRLQN